MSRERKKRATALDLGTQQIPAGLLHVAKRVQVQHGVQKSIQIKMSITFCHQVNLAMETAEVEKGVFGLW